AAGAAARAAAHRALAPRPAARHAGVHGALVLDPDALAARDLRDLLVRRAVVLDDHAGEGLHLVGLRLRLTELAERDLLLVDQVDLAEDELRLALALALALARRARRAAHPHAAAGAAARAALLAGPAGRRALPVRPARASAGLLGLPDLLGPPPVVRGRGAPTGRTPQRGLDSRGPIR